MVAPPPIQLASLGMADSLILMVLALVVFGPRRLPQIGRQIGKLMYEFRKASNDFKFQMEEELRLSEEADRRKKEEAERERVAALAATSQASVSAPAQSVEAQADIGAAESPTASPYPGEGTYPSSNAGPYPPETPAESTEQIAEQPTGQATEVSAEQATEPSSESAIQLRPPQTGEQVSSSFPFLSDAEEAAAELNPEATTEANAESVEAHAAAAVETETAMSSESVASPVSNGVEPAPVPQPEIESATPPKEPVSQHG